MRLPPVVLALALLLAWPLAAAAQTEREHGVHVHGRSQIDLVCVAGQLEMELHAPGMDIVGFEHPPRDESESQAIAQALSALETHGQWLGFEPAGACTVTSTEVHTHGYKAVQNSDNAGHEAATDHHHDPHGAHGEHEHESDHDHAEFHLSIKAECGATPKALLIHLNERFSGLERIRIDYVTDTVQNRVELGRGKTRVPLQ